MIFTRVLLLSVLVASSIAAISQTSENFNSRPGIAFTELKNYLEGNCWQFPGFDFYTNAPSPEPIVEGDGTLVSSPGLSTVQGAGIYTPLLNMGGTTSISFKYAFNEDIIQPQWIKLYLMTADNQIHHLLESIEVTNSLANTIYTYQSTLTSGSGPYKIFVNFDAVGSTQRIGIDELVLGSNKFYPGGCNAAPNATPDQFMGAPNRTAAGNITTNDVESDSEPVTVYLVENAADGDVVLAPDGSFTFTPNAGFTGNSTSFVYKICDNGYGPLCSESITVTIQFPAAGILPVSLTEFKAVTKDNAIELTWITGFENNNEYFNIERSIDGRTFEKVGTIKGNGTTGISNAYVFTDHIRKGLADKNDLYYRLKQVNLDGSPAYSKVLVVRLYKTKSLQMVSVTPNPAVNDIKVNVQLNENAFIVMKVVNSFGHEIKRQTLKGITGENNITLVGTSGLAKGIYFLEVIINSNERMMVKLIKD